MKKRADGSIVLSASDLTAASHCEWAFVKKLEFELGLGPEPPSVEDAMMAITSEMGLAHEQRVLEKLRQQYGDVAEISDPKRGDEDYLDRLKRSHEETLEALDARRKVIFQAAFYSGDFQGFADFLIWHDEGYYEVVDTKLARSAKVTALMQLAAYAGELRAIGVPVGPQVSLWLGNGEVSTHALADIEPVFRLRMARLRAIVDHIQQVKKGELPASTWFDDDFDFCGDCAVCEISIEEHDDLQQIAGIRGDQREKIHAEGIYTMAALAESDEAIDELNPQTLANLRAQARAQIQTRISGDSTPYVAFDRPEGLRALPNPSPGDIFFDFEGDPLFEHDGQFGLDYLFGWVDAEGKFDHDWADSLEEEKDALERFVDLIFDIRDVHPGMHVYHYASYEQSHLLQLAQRYGTREEEVDELVRDHVLVNLLPIVKHSLRLGEPSYSIKYLEKVYLDPPRQGDVTNAVDSVIDYHRYRAALENGEDATAQGIKDSVLEYNETDCVSTLQLYHWLLKHRTVEYVAPEPREKKQLEEDDVDNVRDELRALVADIPIKDRTPNETAIALAAEAVDYHRREHRTFWWSHFRRLSDPVSDWEDERGVIMSTSASLVYDWEPKRAWSYRRIRVEGRFAPGTTIKPGHEPFVIYDPTPSALVDPTNPLSRGVAKKATVVEVGDDYVILDEGSRIEDGAWNNSPLALAPPAPPFDGHVRQAIRSWGTRILLSLPKSMPDDPALDILRRVPPRGIITYPEEVATVADAITESVRSLKDSYMAVQGPPGTGKTFNGAQVVVNLVNSGWKVGVVAQSHAAVENLMKKCAELGLPPSRMGKKSQQGASPGQNPPWTVLPTNPAVGEFLATLGGVVVGGTVWTFCNEKAMAPKALDLIVVEEAGQFSLANTIAVSTAAKRLLLLGDPQQLAEVSQGAHPEPIDTSALGWLSENHDVLPRERGIFLDTSYRMHPALCAVVSELAYEDKLGAAPHADRHLDGVSAGLAVRRVEHSGNSVESSEEALEVVRILEEVLPQDWTQDGVTRPLRDWPSNAIVVAPYNAQVNLIKRELEHYGFGDIPVGTVDKFQGQEAPVAIVSMAASTLRDVPRGMDFLLSRNRLNVALSRAQWASFLVFSPGLLDYLPHTPKNLALLSRFARLTERAVALHS